MKRLFVLVLFISTFLYSYDATIEVVKKNSKLPYIAVEKTPSLGVDERVNAKFYKVLVGDLKVSSNFKVYD